MAALARQPGSWLACGSPAGGCNNKLGSQQRPQKPAGSQPARLPAAARPIASSSSRAQLSGQVVAAVPFQHAGHAAVAPAQLAAHRLVRPEGANNILELNEFRRGVGLCIYRADGLVFAARRVDDPQRSWQMPQGGIDPLENPMRAALRELHEETGITSCRIVASIDHWLEYSFPTKVKAHVDGSFLKYRGQTQKWFLLEFYGQDSEIDLSCHGHPEFSDYSWVPLEALPAGVVDFKQPVYHQVARHFAPEIARRVGRQA